ncbi:hypothetical protein BD779DRAFT_1494828 [Infundibulicybe gibba]|nr:hypothetical protein BD779DRAFT_1494828 [Infundibulicybe gibba]
MVQKHIFLTGATGYIGGSVLSRLLSHPLARTFHITALVRSPARAKDLEALGVTVVLGSNADLSLLRQSAREADIIVACADADDLAAARAILDGIEERYRQTGVAPRSSTRQGVLVDDAGGMHDTDQIYSDLDIPKLESLPASQPHRNVDLELVAADSKGYAKTHIILPSTIYGVATGILVDKKLQNAHSQQIPALVKVSLARGQGGMVGRGDNIWPNVHIDDALAHGREGFYFAENGEHTMYDIAKTIAQVLCDMGRGESPEPTTFTEKEIKRYFPNGTSLGTNSRCRADRSRGVGWKPVKGTIDMLSSIRDEVEYQC